MFQFQLLLLFLLLVLVVHGGDELGQRLRGDVTVY